MKCYLSILFLFFFFADANAQEVSYHKKILSLFGEDVIGVWIKHYRGQIDELNDAYMALGNDEKMYRGILVQNGNEELIVEGSYDVRKLQLLVLNGDEVVIGYIKGQIMDSLIVADLFNNDHSMIRKLKLRRQIRPTESDNCSEGKWIRQLEGKVLDEDVEIIIQKEELGLLSGLITFNDKKVSYHLQGECTDDLCQESNLRLKNERKINLGALNVSQGADDSCYISIGRNSDDVIRYPIKKIQEWNVLCKTTMKGQNRINYILPMWSGNAYRTWIKNKVFRWQQVILKNINGNDRFSLMNEYRAWVDLDFVNEKLISGTLTYTNPKGNGFRREAFTFASNGDGPINISDAFKDEQLSDRTLNEFINKEKSLAVEEGDEVEYINWIGKQRFKHKSIKKEGLCLKSDYSLIFGEREFVIPWTLLEKMMRRSHAVVKYID